MNIVKILDILRDKELRLNIPDDIELSYGDHLLIKAPKETFVAQALESPRKVPNIKNENDLVFDRILDEKEIKDFEKTQGDGFERTQRAQKMADKLGLKIKFFESRIGWKGRMISFFFTSANPIDFRDLLKEMIQGFKGRIHLERVSDRQRTRIVGGVGSCGRADCCQFLHFNNKKVSLDAVRDQGIMINNNPKIFGLHNKIKTCLLYELDDYRKNRKYLPHIRQEVTVGKQSGRVIGLDILNRTVKIFLENDTIEVFPVADVAYENKREAPKEPELSFEEYDVTIDGELSV